MGLKAKFNLVMIVAFLAGLGIAAALAWRFAQEDARRAVMQEANLMMGQATAVGDYTDREIAPLLADQLKVHFLPQAIPFFAAQANFRRLREQFPSYSFAEAALNPTNPADRATDWQADIINTFREHPKLTDLVAERQTPTGPVLTYSHPVGITDQGCLVCHSTPAAAPASMVELYGPDHGFGWKLHEVVGAQIVSVPMRVALARANHLFLMFLGGLAAVFLVTLILMNLLLHYVIVKPVRRIADLAGEVSLGNLAAPEYTPRGRDEIASLAESFNRMRRSLDSALKMLEE